jgi:hypothetical protein
LCRPGFAQTEVIYRRRRIWYTEKEFLVVVAIKNATQGTILDGHSGRVSGS